MRSWTFDLIGTIVCGIILFSLYALVAYFELWLPRLDQYFLDIGIGHIESKVFGWITVVLAAPILFFILKPFNQKLRAWRKSRGRDIEEEEKYETEFGILTLTEKKK